MSTRRILSALAAASGAVLLAVAGDPLCLQLVGYLPMLIAAWVTGSDSLPSAAEILGQWEIWRSALVIAAATGLFWGARRLWPERHLLGRLDRPTLHRLLNIAVAVAMICPLFYALTRTAWYLGWPLGLSEGFLQQIQPIVRNGLVLALGGVGGALLTFGLTRPWGRRFPRWIPRLGGRRVPVGLARNSALTVALLVAAAGCYFIRALVTGSVISIAPPGAHEHWGAWLPEMLWPLWGLALAIAAIAYAEQRRRADGDN